MVQNKQESIVIGIGDAKKYSKYRSVGAGDAFTHLQLPNEALQPTYEKKRITQSQIEFG